MQDRLRRSPLRSVAFWGIAALGTFAWLWPFREALVDDVFITLLYARNVVEHGVWGAWPERLGNSATSPFNVLVLAAFGLIARDWIVATLLAATIAYLACGLVVTRLLRRVSRRPWVPWVAYLALLVNPMLLSTLGMEALFQGATLLVMAEGWLARRWLPVAIAGGLGILVRPEGALFLLVYGFTFPGSWRVRSRVLTWGVLLAVPWFVFAWTVLGTVLPETFFVKSGQGPWAEQWTVANGWLMFLERYRAETVASLAPWLGLLVLALPTGGEARRAAGPLVAGACIHFVAYSLLAVPPFHWYYAVELVVGVVVAGLAMASLAESSRSRRAVAAVLGVILVAASVWLDGRRLAAPDPEMPIHTNWAPSNAYRTIGEWLGELGTSPVISNGEVGTLAFYCRCELLDPLTHPGTLFGLVRRTIDAGGARAWAYRVNFAFYDWPEGPPRIEGGFVRPPSPSYALRPGEERFVLRSRWIPEGRELIWIPRRSPASPSASDDSSPMPDRP